MDESMDQWINGSKDQWMDNILNATSLAFLVHTNLFIRPKLFAIVTNLNYAMEVLDHTFVFFVRCCLTFELILFIWIDHNSWIYHNSWIWQKMIQLWIVLFHHVGFWICLAYAFITSSWEYTIPRVTDHNFPLEGFHRSMIWEYIIYTHIHPQYQQL